MFKRRTNYPYEVYGKPNVLTSTRSNQDHTVWARIRRAGDDIIILKKFITETVRMKKTPRIRRKGGSQLNWHSTGETRSTVCDNSTSPSRTVKLKKKKKIRS